MNKIDKGTKQLKMKEKVAKKEKGKNRKRKSQRQNIYNNTNKIYGGDIKCSLNWRHETGLSPPVK